VEPIDTTPVQISERLAEASFRCLYADHAREILAYALRRVQDPEDAADVGRVGIAVGARSANSGAPTVYSLIADPDTGAVPGDRGEAAASAVGPAGARRAAGHLQHRLPGVAAYRLDPGGMAAKLTSLCGELRLTRIKVIPASAP
jgi:hypothetical protein